MAVVSQPFDELTVAPGMSGDVLVRAASEKDGAFVSRCEVYAFEDKTVYMVGRNRLAALSEAMTQDFHYRSAAFHRIFIAEYQGRPAGVLKISFPDDHTDYEGFTFSNYRRAVGCCAILRLSCVQLPCVVETPKSTQCYLDVLCVDEGFRGKGIGKILLERADWEARRKGCEEIYLHVLTTNRAKGLYERHGYVNQGIKDYGCCIDCAMGVSKFYIMVKSLS